MSEKLVYFEESMGVPFLIRWPNNIAPRQDDLLLGTPDIMPTLLSLMGLDDQIPTGVEGTDLSRNLLGDQAERPNSSFYVSPAPKADRRGLRTLRHTYAVQRLPNGDSRICLYDNEQDPYQLDNVAEREPALVAALDYELRGWLEKTNDPWISSG